MFGRKKRQQPPTPETLDPQEENNKAERSIEELTQWLERTKARLDEAAKQVEALKDPNKPIPIRIVGYHDVVRNPKHKFAQSELIIPGMDHATVTIQQYDSGHIAMSSKVPPQTKSDTRDKAIETELKRCVNLIYKMYEPDLTTPKIFRLTSVSPARFAEKVRDMLLADGYFQYVWHDGDRWKMENGKAVKAPPENDLGSKASEVHVPGPARHP